MFPSTLKSPSLPRRSNSLNATQQKPSSYQLFETIEQELHDAKRVHSHGQEEDLRSALSMVIDRVGELFSLLSEAYKAQVDLETQLNLAKSNLNLVIANNEMLEEALRQNSGNSKDVGWRRRSARENSRKECTTDQQSHDLGNYSANETTPNGVVVDPPLTARAASPAPQDTRFFKFRFNNSNTNGGKTPTRPGTPGSPTMQNGLSHLSSPSLPSIPVHIKELEELTATLEKERVARQKAVKEKEALEAELESLSQALFEEANKMVASERIKRAETEEELREAVLEKEALRSALRLIEGENMHLRSSSSTPSHSVDTSPVIPASLSHSRTSSRIAIKSRPISLTRAESPSPLTATLPPSPPGDTDSPNPPTTPASVPESAPELTLHTTSEMSSPPIDPLPSPWADVQPTTRNLSSYEANMPLYAAAAFSMR